MCLYSHLLKLGWIQGVLLIKFLWLPWINCQVYTSYEYKYPWELEEYEDPYHYELEDYDGGDYGGYGGGYGATRFYYEYELEKPKPEPMQCYTCHFSKRQHHEQGMANCDEPFREEGIPLITCDGACARTRTVIGDGEYMLIRSCLPNCKNVAGPLSIVECCYGTKCNGARAVAAATTSTKVEGAARNIVLAFALASTRWL